MTQPRHAFDPQRIARVGRLDLVARRAVEGFLAGVHPSPYYGSSVEHADHRPYSPGDELRRIDWKLLAKSDRHFIRLFEEQTNTRLTLVVDASASMARVPQDNAAAQPPDKLRYAASLAAGLAYLAVKQNDAVGLALCDHQLRTHVPARGTARHYRLLLEHLESAQPGVDTRLAPPLHELAGRLRSRGVVVLISDLLDEPAELAQALDHLRHKRHEVIVIQLIDPRERDFPFTEVARFTDPETNEQRVLHPRAVRDAYHARLRSFLESSRRMCLQRSVDHTLIATDEPFDQALRAYLARRVHAARRGGRVGAGA